jgi:ATP adenylyltransferase
MQVLWAPWRVAYVGAPKPPGCIFCDAAHTTEPRDRLVLVQRPALVMLNRFPYAYGHLMVAPVQHSSDLGALPADDFQSLMAVLQRSIAGLGAALGCEGMNVGMNLGAVAGAGIADHVHWHLVPRWAGDTNFMPLLADVRVMPAYLESVYDRLHPLFAQSAAPV